MLTHSDIILRASKDPNVARHENKLVEMACNYKHYKEKYEQYLKDISEHCQKNLSLREQGLCDNHLLSLSQIGNWLVLATEAWERAKATDHLFTQFCDWHNIKSW